MENGKQSSISTLRNMLNYDLQLARATPPTNKVFVTHRKIEEWHWLVDNLYTDEKQQVSKLIRYYCDSLIMIIFLFISQKEYNKLSVLLLKKSCKANANKKKKKEYEHTGGSRPFLKHKEVAEKVISKFFTFNVIPTKFKQSSFVSYWTRKSIKVKVNVIFVE